MIGDGSLVGEGGGGRGYRNLNRNVADTHALRCSVKADVKDDE